jgi:hypothetical protein
MNEESLKVENDRRFSRRLPKVCRMTEARKLQKIEKDFR